MQPNDVPVKFKHETGPRAGEFFEATFGDGARAHPYKAFIPSGYHGQPLPLIVMLHGCTQNPDDFALGTRMNAAAEQEQCVVVYPAQIKSANGSLCWNWFSPDDQHRDHGEPAIIAGITREIMHRFHVDPRRVFIAGMSAGGAMAVIVAASYPELYRAVGVHSGMPYKAATNLFYALTAMKYGNATPVAMQAPAIPTIVFHGDKDRKVHPDNGDHIVAQAVAGRPAENALLAPTRQAGVKNGRGFTRLSFRNADGDRMVEHWVVHGGGHAWSGGNARGSHTDPKGPDATLEFLRFFLRDSDTVDGGQPHQVRRGLVARCIDALKSIKAKDA